MVFSEQALQDEHILITGATGGIGYETAKAAVLAGATVSVTGRNEDKLEELQKEVESLNAQGKLIVIPADLNNATERLHLVEEATQKGGTLTGLVNSAGISGGGTLDELEEEEMRKVMELNYFSTVLLTQLVYERLIPEKKGAIVNVSSLSGLRGTHGNIAYSASKFAVTGFTQSFAVEAIEHGVRVNAVCPGFVDTEMGRSAIEKKGKAAGRSFEEQLKIAEEGLPSGRITQPEEVARSIIFLLSDAAENIVGESMKISGGSVMR
ncbi:SDR family NAD(P)-dependent oxidoreductase [Jeotgalibacillus proteolyticus]|uniref:Short-chain dehydrogenase n=1 Tax=Jeotgalibacillus proteolyticus TaxID=2082395 RepID=A0A2S5GCA2_9BACL|nr:SDR family oxidoreductase [Jeotgalibacillus proteolyticus]PPA70667.1 short-chain dehydrogenase [Jeotgalibacillus proteolyticus]